MGFRSAGYSKPLDVTSLVLCSVKKAKKTWKNVFFWKVHVKWVKKNIKK